MSTTRRCGVSGSARFLPVLLLAVLATVVACVSAPEEAAEEASEEAPAAAEAASSGESRPEVVEIRGSVPLPPRMVLVLSDPEPKPTPGTASRLPVPSSTVPGTAAPEIAASADAPPAPTTPAQPVPSAEPPAPTAESPKPSAVPAEKSAETKPAAPVPPAPKKPAAAVPAPKTSAAPAARTPAPAAGTASPAVAETPAPARPAPALTPAPGSTARTVPEPAPTPGRTEEAVRGSPLELPFRGSGWVYLGEIGGRDGLRYETRKFDGSQAVFLFTAERPGEYQLRFQRQDSFSGEPENLIVKVTVREPEPATGSQTRPAEVPATVVERPAAAAPAAASTGSTPSPSPTRSAPSSAAAVPAAAAPIPPPDSALSAAEAPPVRRDLPSAPEELLRLAREDLAASRIAGVLEVLERYMVLFPFGSDEAHYLYAKAYEQNTPYRDIKKAYANYRKVRDEWPRSPFWRESAERVTYIERHYFDIR